MKSIMIAVLLTAVLASPALAQGQSLSVAPWRGLIPTQAVRSCSSSKSEWQRERDPSGRFTMTVEWQIDVSMDPAPGVGTFTLTAANGDTLFGTSTGLGLVVGGIA